MDTTVLPTDAAAGLVAGHVDQLWQQWANDTEMPGCCPVCCAPCHALKQLLELGLLDELYGVYADHVGGELSTWDPKQRMVRRDWLEQAWSVDRGGCHQDDC